MPIEREVFQNKASGRYKAKILQLLSDGRGYYFSEIHAEIGGHESTVRKLLSELDRLAIIESATMPELGTGKAKVYALTEKALLSSQLIDSMFNLSDSSSEHDREPDEYQEPFPNPQDLD
jgi:predicted transcriptional regulator